MNLFIINRSLIIFLLFSLAACAKEETVSKANLVRPVKTFVVADTGVIQYVYPGKVEAVQHVDLSFRVSGPLVEFPVNEGDEVEKGDLLVKIDQRDFEIAVSKAKAELDKAEADYKRTENLFKSNAVSKAELDDKTSSVEVARSNFKTAKADLDDTELKAPFTGLVGETYVENFQYVQEKEPVISLLDMTAVEIDVDVPEEVILNKKLDQAETVFATFTTLDGRKFPLYLKEFCTQADEVTQTYRVTFIMKQPKDLRILQGMTAEVHINVPEPGQKGRVIVPSKAVAADAEGKSYVWKVDEKSLVVKKQPVRTGQITGEKSIEILEGLDIGERIAAAGIHLLHENMKIKIME